LQANVYGLHEFDFFVQGDEHYMGMRRPDFLAQAEAAHGDAAMGLDGKEEEHHIREEHPINELRRSTVEKNYQSIESHLPEEHWYIRGRVFDLQAEANLRVSQVLEAGEEATDEMKTNASQAENAVLGLKKHAAEVVTGVGHGVLHAAEEFGLAIIGSYDGNNGGHRNTKVSPRASLQEEPLSPVNRGQKSQTAGFLSPRMSDNIAEAHLQLAILCARCLQHLQQERCTMEDCVTVLESVHEDLEIEHLSRQNSVLGASISFDQLRDTIEAFDSKQQKGQHDEGDRGEDGERRVIQSDDSTGEGLEMRPIRWEKDGLRKEITKSSLPDDSGPPMTYDIGDHSPWALHMGAESVSIEVDPVGEDAAAPNNAPSSHTSRSRSRSRVTRNGSGAVVVKI